MTVEFGVHHEGAPWLPTHRGTPSNRCTRAINGDEETDLEISGADRSRRSNLEMGGCLDGG
jgi:hypothetical protein